MANLNLPPPPRVPVGSLVVGGQRVDVVLSTEWARYFESLNSQVNITTSAVGLPGAPGATGAAGAAVSFMGSDSEGETEFLPLVGPQGPAGASALPLFLLQSEPEPSDSIPQVVSPDETFIAPTLLNSWVNYDITTYNAAGFYKDSHGIVHLRGMVKSGVVGNSIFTLPAGYRPNRLEVFAVVSNNLFGQVNVDTAGDIKLAFGSNVFATLDGITFRAAGTY